jgi:hypothetical protein
MYSAGDLVFYESGVHSEKLVSEAGHQQLVDNRSIFIENLFDLGEASLIKVAYLLC